MIPVGNLARDRGIVLVEWMRQEPITCSLRRLGMMKSGVGERQNAGACHRSSVARLLCRVHENPFALVEAAFNECHGGVDSFGRNRKTGVSRGAKKHQFPTGN